MKGLGGGGGGGGDWIQSWTDDDFAMKAPIGWACTVSWL